MTTRLRSASGELHARLSANAAARCPFCTRACLVRERVVCRPRAAGGAIRLSEKEAPGGADCSQTRHDQSTDERLTY